MFKKVRQAFPKLFKDIFLTQKNWKQLW